MIMKRNKRSIPSFAVRFLAIALILVLLVPMLFGCGQKVVNAPSSQPSTLPSVSEPTGESPTQPTEQLPPQVKVKNVIFMIADGGGYDNFTLADKAKEEMTKRGINKLTGAKTEVSTNLLEPLGISEVKGLYLDELLVGSANTLLTVPHGKAEDYKSYITDSSAAATALSSGYKTNYRYAGIDSDKVPRASISELARMKGMSTGLVTTKSYVDATPLAFFTAHSIDRHQYQDNSLQALLSGIDVVIGEGTEYGDVVDGKASSHPEISVSSMGYTVARSKTELLAQASTATKLWAPILGVDNSLKDLKDKDAGIASDHITYDVDAAQSAEQPSLLDMTKAALQVLGDNINNPEGFFLMIEGGALDNAAEAGYLRPAVGEYLAFDEAFGYCVNWAASRGDTIVIAVPDHDSGGFSGIESCEAMLIDSIISGQIGEEEFHSLMKFGEIKEALSKMGADTKNMALHGGHTDMAVPISLYAPDTVRNELLTNLALPTDSQNVRKGNSLYYVENAHNSFMWYSSPALNDNCIIDNIKIAPAIVKTLKMGSLDEATQQLFCKLVHYGTRGSEGEYGGKVTLDRKSLSKNEYASYYKCSYESKDKALVVQRNAASYQLNGEEIEIAKIGKLLPRTLYVLDEHSVPNYGTFYVPASILKSAGLN